MTNIANMTTTAGASKLSMPRMLLSLEGLTVFVGAVLVFAHLHASGLLFALLILAPDLSMIGYAKHVRLGSIIYNAAHTYIAPALLMLLALTTNSDIGAHIALIWFAHIGMDRMMGFGLKYATKFKDTHLNRV